MRVATCVLCVCILVHAKQLVLQVSTLRIQISTYVAEPSQGKSQPLTKPKPVCTFVSLNLSSLYFSVHVYSTSVGPNNPQTNCIVPNYVVYLNSSQNCDEFAVQLVFSCKLKVFITGAVYVWPRCFAC